MNKRYLLFFCCGIFLTKAFSQDTLTKKQFTKVLNEQFSNLVTGQSKTTLGNFASLDLKEAEVSFAGNTITKKGQILGLKASGGVSDGLFSIFNNSTLNTKISIEGQFHFLNRKPKMVSWYTDSDDDYQNKINELNEKYRLKFIEAQNNMGKINLMYKQRKIEKALTILKEEIKNEAKDSLRLDSLKFAISLSEAEFKITDSLIKAYPIKDDIIEELSNSKAKELKKLKVDLELYAFKLGWFSSYYKVTSNSFKQFYPSLPVNNQISDTSFVSHEVKIQYNSYYWTKDAYKTYFFSVGLAFALTDNFNDLTKREITEIKNYGANPNDRTTTKKYNTFVGDYEKNLKQVTIYADYYKFLFSNNVAALHFYPEFNFRTNTKPLYNLGVGFLLALKDNKKEDKSIVNAELFYNFLDLTKNSDTDLKFLERNNIGLRFTFPINFINK